MGSMTAGHDIAIAGMAGVFALAPDLAALQEVFFSGVDATGPAPPLRAASAGSRPGGFAPLVISAESRPAPAVLRASDPWHLVAIDVARRAVRDAGLDPDGEWRRRAGVIVGASTLLGRPQRLWAQAAHGGLPRMDSDLVAAVHPSVLAGRIAAALDLRGPQAVVDVSCASAAAALQQAVLTLEAHAADVMIVGAVGPYLDAGMEDMFAAVGMLADVTCRPFMEDSEGTLLGEGTGFLVLMRGDDVKSGRTWSRIRGIGQSSDGRSLGPLTSRPEGLGDAIDRAWNDAGIGPGAITLVEAHAIGTALGDRAEWRELSRRRDDATWMVGSVTANLGHALAAGGMAAIIRACMQLRYRAVAPALGTGPRRGIEQEAGQVVPTSLAPLPGGDLDVPIAVVNMLAFGGANGHVVLEAPDDGLELSMPAWPVEVILLGAETGEELIRVVDELIVALDAGTALSVLAAQAPPVGAPLRAAMPVSSVAEARERLGAVRAALSAGRTRMRRPDGTSLDLVDRQPRVGFMCPGEGAQYSGMLREVAACIPSVRRWCTSLDGALVAADLTPMTPRMWAQPFAPIDPAGLSGVRGGTQALAVASIAMADLFATIGVRPTAVMGQSSGEFAAGVISGAVASRSVDVLMPVIKGISRAQSQAADAHPVPTGRTMSVTGLPSADACAAVDTVPGAFITTVSTQTVTVAWAPLDAADALEAELVRRGALVRDLPFTLPYHTPLFRPRAQMLGASYDAVEVRPPDLPWYSCSTAARMPDDPGEIRSMLGRQWWQRVDVASTLHRVVEEQNLTCLVEVGPGTTLSACAADALRDSNVLVLAVDGGRGGLSGLARCLALLHVHGVDLDISTLHSIRDQRPDHVPLAERVDLLELDPNIGVPVGTVASAPGRPGGAPQVDVAHVVDVHLSLMRQFLDTQAIAAGTGLHAPAPPRPAPISAVGAPSSDWLLGECVDRGRDHAVYLKVFDPASDRFLSDHAIGGQVSQRDHSLTPLAVVPFTVSMEVVGLAASSLVGAGAVCVGLEALRAHRWIALDGGRATARIEACRRPDDPSRVDVTITLIRDPQIGPAEPDDSGPEYVAFEGTAVFASAYPEAPSKPEPPMEMADRPKGLYSGLFHGAAFRSIETVDLLDDTGVWARGRRRRPDPDPDRAAEPLMLLDPFLLDSCGQLVSFWANTRVTEVSGAFPYAADAYHWYAPVPDPGTQLVFRVTILDDPGVGTRADISIMDEGGRVLAEFIGLRQRVFAFPGNFLRCLLDPGREYLSKDWPLADGIVLRRFDRGDREMSFLQEGYGIWARVLAHMSLDAGERRAWYGMRAQPARRIEWLLGRIVIKDAVRAWAIDMHGIDLAPADIHVGTTASGAPIVSCPSLSAAAEVPVVSLTHAGEVVAAAVAAPGTLLGIDVEPGDRHLGAAEIVICRESGFGAIVPHPPTLDVLVAKEAASKAVGTGLGGSLSSWPVLSARPDGSAITIGAGSDSSRTFRVRIIHPPGYVLGICHENEEEAQL